MLARWFDRQLESVFFTFYELLCGIGLRQIAPFGAVVMLIAVIGVALLAVLDAFAFAAGAVTIGPISQAPRSVAAVAILNGYFLWGRLASPERIATMESLAATSAPSTRYQRRLKVAALVAVLILVFALMSEA
jgi:hypothetical protein